MTPLKAKAKQFMMRLYALKLSNEDRLAISDKYPRTLLAHRALQHAAMKRTLTQDEQAVMERLEELVATRLKLDGKG